MPGTPAPRKEAPVPRVHHLVVLKFRPETTAKTVAELFRALADLRKVIPGIEHFCGGPYSSPEGLNQGFTHGFVITFTSPAARDAYLTHPEHEAVKHRFLPGVEQVIAFDFEE
jgi:hypothetical protein